MSKTNTTSSAPSTPITEYLSALLDGEAGDFEQRRVLDELKSNNDLRQKLSSYSLIGEAMRSGSATTAIAGTDFLAGIHEKIEMEDEYHQVQLVDEQEEKRQTSSWLRPVGGFALAASLAAVGVIGFQNFQQADTGLTTASLIEQTKSLKDRLSIAEMNSATVVSADQMSVDDDIASIANTYRQADNQTRLLLKRYVDLHMKHASLSTFVPSVRVIAYAD